MISLAVDRQGVKRHQGKVGVLCGVSLVGVYQGYASHVFECPGDILQFWFSHTICGNSSFMLLLVKIYLLMTDTSVYSVTGRKRFVALSPDQIKKISRCSFVSFLISLFFNLRTAFEGLLEELGPSIVPASDNLYQRFQHLIMFHVKIINCKL